MLHNTSDDKFDNISSVPYIIARNGYLNPLVSILAPVQETWSNVQLVFAKSIATVIRGKAGTLQDTNANHKLDLAIKEKYINKESKYMLDCDY
jgi:hypothetical protein